MVELGNEVQDRVTGFKGIVIAETHFLQGCARILVQPKVNKEGVVPDSVSFDEPDIVVTGRGLAPEKKVKPEKPPGGPRKMASRSEEPKRR